jgi:hypothetical protein
VEQGEEKGRRREQERRGGDGWAVRDEERIEKELDSPRMSMGRRCTAKCRWFCSNRWRMNSAVAFYILKMQTHLKRPTLAHPQAQTAFLSTTERRLRSRKRESESCNGVPHPQPH